MGRESEARTFSLLPSFPARLLFFDYCYLYWDTKRKPQRRREPLPLTGAHNKLFVDEWPRSTIKFKDNLIV